MPLAPQSNTCSRAIGSVQAGTGASKRICMGVMVNSQAVVTAANCIFEGPGGAMRTPVGL
jgi:V8-like Glu-specific endopeptidase